MAFVVDASIAGAWLLPDEENMASALMTPPTSPSRCWNNSLWPRSIADWQMRRVRKVSRWLATPTPGCHEPG
ncbi:hypothetical protein SAMN05880582_11188 [Rhizobium sp. RU20A]|uniref:hypothetical protein n=1 Tax=Rhizobium sp. RU20A TaxID=1907412 RepID=UPI0009550466|nr:hypothetical protein [Rhizobium sp. RU20A]SIR37747.1 hypothetical protein SAMN05880582_11188 [Rhizobium sp. RU20A]